MAGKLKIFLGYAPGVGKAQDMVQEARRRKARGEDCVIAIISEGDRLIVNADLSTGMTAIPPLSFEYGGVSGKEINIPLILERRPNTVLVDNLGHMNVQGSSHAYRWQDVEELIQNDINVLATMNVESLESLQDDIYEITGKEIKENVPDRIFHQADEVELVDLTPQALRNRIRRGEIVPEDKIEAALGGYFSDAVLNACEKLQCVRSQREWTKT